MNKKNFSEETSVKIDKAIAKIINSNYEKVREHLVDNIDTLKKLSETLLEKEVLDAADIEAIVNPISPEKVAKRPETDTSPAP